MDLDKFAQFYAKTINGITHALIMKQKVPQEIFNIKYLFVRKATRYNIKYVNTHILKLIDIQKDMMHKMFDDF